MRALILGAPVPMTARVVWQWLAAGHQIEEIWIGHKASGVWHRRDRHLRWLAPTWSLSAAARRFGIPLRKVGPLRRDAQRTYDGCRPAVDVLLSAYFPYIVPEEMLAYYHGRACNLHPALLPRYRGPCPMAAMIFDEALDASGVTLHLMSPRLDEGDIVAQRPVNWPADGWYRTWEADLADGAAHLVAHDLPKLLKGALAATPQSGPANYVRELPPDGLVLSERMTQRRARWLCNSLGRMMPLTVPIGNRTAPAGELLSSQSRRQHLPAQLAWRRVECDVADARLSLRRWDSLQRRSERLRELVGLARRPLAA